MAGMTKRYYFKFVFRNGESQILYTTDHEDKVTIRRLTTEGTTKTAEFTPDMWADEELGLDANALCRVNVVDVIAVQEWEKLR